MKKYSLFLAVLVFYGACSTTENNSEKLTDAEAFAKLVGGKSVYVGASIEGFFSGDGTEFTFWGPNSIGPYTLNKGSVKNYGNLGFDAVYTRPPYIGQSFSSVTENGGKNGRKAFTFNRP